MPTVYVPHGGGPWPFVDVGFGDPDEWQRLRDYLAALASVPPEKPRAVLVVTAHWEEPRPTVSSSAAPPMLYDYGGFPPAAYALSWPAPGDPGLAAEVCALLESAGIASAANPTRGFDHGTFVPMKLAYPMADVPCVQLSLVRGLDPLAHLAIGRALEPLRNQGVFIVGSGSSYHNMQGFGVGAALAASVEFDSWLRAVVVLSRAEREAALVDWANAPSARRCHPREEHLLPLMVVAGAAGGDLPSVSFSDRVMGVRLSAVQFG